MDITNRNISTDFRQGTASGNLEQQSDEEVLSFYDLIQRLFYALLDIYLNDTFKTSCSWKLILLLRHIVSHVSVLRCLTAASSPLH